MSKNPLSRLTEYGVVVSARKALFDRAIVLIVRGEQCVTVFDFDRSGGGLGGLGGGAG